MGRDRYRILDPTAPYFVTCTVLEWLPLFSQPANVEILFSALRFLQQESGVTLFGYVVMENHCHLLLRAPNLPKALASFKSYTAAQIIARLTERNSPVLRLLALHKARHKTDRTNQVWQEGSHPEQSSGEAMMLQKLDYILRPCVLVPG